jgi:hypothetical protein
MLSRSFSRSGGPVGEGRPLPWGLIVMLLVIVGLIIAWVAGCQ